MSALHGAGRDKNRRIIRGIINTGIVAYSSPFYNPREMIYIRNIRDARGCNQRTSIPRGFKNLCAETFGYLLKYFYRLGRGWLRGLLCRRVKISGVTKSRNFNKYDVQSGHLVFHHLVYYLTPDVS